MYGLAGSGRRCLSGVRLGHPCDAWGQDHDGDRPGVHAAKLPLLSHLARLPGAGHSPLARDFRDSLDLHVHPGSCGSQFVTFTVNSRLFCQYFLVPFICPGRGGKGILGFHFSSVILGGMGYYHNVCTFLFPPSDRVRYNVVHLAKTEFSSNLYVV